jgi:hypothetical protein
MMAGIVTTYTFFAHPCTRACPHAESIILSAPPAESMMLSVHAESIILSVPPAENMILSAQPAVSMIPLSACADTLGACQEQHTEGKDDDKYAEGDNNNEHLDDNNDNEYAEGGWRTITAEAEAMQREVMQDGRQQQSQWTAAARSFGILDLCFFAKFTAR